MKKILNRTTRPVDSEPAAWQLVMKEQRRLRPILSVPWAVPGSAPLNARVSSLSSFHVNSDAALDFHKTLAILKTKEALRDRLMTNRTILIVIGRLMVGRLSWLLIDVMVRHCGTQISTFKYFATDLRYLNVENQNTISDHDLP